MTIAALPSEVVYNGDGVTTSFFVPFPFDTSADLAVIATDTTGVPTTLSTGFSVVGGGGATGSVLFVIAPTVRITILDNPAQTQPTDYVNLDAFPAESHERALDRITRLCKRLHQQWGRTVRFPDGDLGAGGSLPSANLRKLKALMFDSNGDVTVGTPVAGTITGDLIISLLTGAQIGGVLYPRTAAEIAVSVTPVNLNYAPGDIRRHGVTFSGSDETALVSNWLKVGGGLTFPVAQTVMVTGALVLSSNTTITGVKGATIQTATHDVNILQATLQSGITIRGLHFKQTSAGSSSGVAHILLDRCTNCLVENNECEGTQFRGIWAPGVQYCTFRANYFHDALGRGPSTSDIDLSSTTTPAKFNVIDGNQCFGGAEFGISVWDPDSGVIPSRNIICNNRVQGQSGYGILIYMPNASDTFNQVIGNSVQDVTGGHLPSGNTSSGAGIYVVGAGAGGTIVANNTVVNCCISTEDESLAPGGIGISGTSANSAPITVTGNVISNMTKYHGIVATGCLGGITITGNTVLQPASNTTGHCIKVANCDNYTVGQNTLNQLNTTSSQRGVLIHAQSGNCTNGTVTGNTIKGGHQSYIETVQSGVGGPWLVSGLTISGNVGDGGDNSLIPLLLNSASCADVMVLGNHLSGGNATVVSQTACTNVRYSLNRLKGTGTAVLTTSGVCTGSFFDRSNFGTGSGAGVVNAGTGLIVEVLGTGNIAAGTWAVGDTQRETSPSTAGVYERICTVAGTGGGTATFKTISNT